MSKFVELAVAEKVGLNFLNTIRKQYEPLPDTMPEKPITKAKVKKQKTVAASPKKELNLVLRADSEKSVIERIYEKREAIKKRINIKEEGDPCFYILNDEAGGFVIVSAEENCDPILGYSYKGKIDINDMPPALEYLLESYRKEILKIREKNIVSNEEIKARWQTFKSGGASLKTTRGRINVKPEDVIVAPLIKTLWDQWPLYNYYSPIGYPAGCVAVAMAQVMKYYEWPKRGKGKNTYDDSSTPCWDKFKYNDKNCPGLTYNGRDVTADFENTEYDYLNMPIKLRSDWTEIKAVATLIRHCGISVNMDYWKSGSHPDLGLNGGAFNREYIMGLKALHEHFRYNKASADLDTYDKDWKDKIKRTLDEGRVVLYRAGIPHKAHVFICDGYAKNDCFHFNFGWSERGDGFYKFGSFVVNVDGKKDYDRMPYASFNLKPDKPFVIFNVTCNIKSFFPVLDVSDNVPIYPYGTVPVVKGYSRTFKLKNMTNYSVPYIIDSVKHNGVITKIASDQRTYTVEKVFSGGTIEVLLKPQKEFVVDGIKYKAITYDTAAVLGVYNNTNTNITIPQKVTYKGQEFNVNEIVANAFKNNRSIKEFSAPYIKKIGEGAFRSCANLKSVSIKNVDQLEANIFENCKNLNKAELSKLGEIPEGTFNGCESLQTLIKTGIPSIVGKNAFKNCKKLVLSGDFVNNIRIVEEGAFQGCEKLSIELNNTSLKDLPKNVFNGSGIISINLPAFSGEIGESAFGNCVNLTSVSMEKVLEIGEKAFYGCSKLKNCSDMPNIKVISNSAFENCSLKKMPLSKNLKVIRAKAFARNPIDSIILPYSVNSIDSEAFSGCHQVNLIESYSDEPPKCAENAFRGISTSIPVYVPYNSISKYKRAPAWKNFTNYLPFEIVKDGVKYRIDTSSKASVIGVIKEGINPSKPPFSGESASLALCIDIESYISINGNRFMVNNVYDKAFFNASYLKSVRFNSSASFSIGNNAFEGCTGIEKIVLYCSNPPTLPKSEPKNVFKGMHKDGTLKHIELYVPGKSIDRYKKALVWQDFTIKGFFVPSPSPSFWDKFQKELDKLKKEIFLDNLGDYLKYDFTGLLDIITRNPLVCNEIFDEILSFPEGIELVVPVDINARYQTLNERNSKTIESGIKALKIVDTFIEKDMNTIMDSLKINGKKIIVNNTLRTRNAKEKTKTVNRQTEKIEEMFLNSYIDSFMFSLQKFQRLLEERYAKYCISKRAQKSGEREIHVLGCKYMPSQRNLRELGVFASQKAALEAAKVIYPKSDGCYYCCPEIDSDKLKRIKKVKSTKK